MSDVQPLTPITLEDQRGTKYAFCPQSDISPLESVLIAQLFTKMLLTARTGAVDWPTYVAEHRLIRHFAIVGTMTDIWRAALEHKILSPEAEEKVHKLLGTAREVYTGPRTTVEEAKALTDVEPRRVRYVATHDIGGSADMNVDEPPTWIKGAVLTLLEGMPVPEGFVPAPDEDMGAGKVH